MAKSLKDYKRKEYRAVVVEDFETGIVKTIFNQEDIKKAIDNYTELEVTKIYNPSDEIKAEVMKLVQADNEGKEVKAEVTDSDIVVKIIPMLTDMDVNGLEDEAILKEVLANPDNVMLAVSSVINQMLLEMISNYFATFKMLGSLPQEFITELSKNMDRK